MAKIDNIDISNLFQLLEYDSETGFFLWKPRTPDMFLNSEAINAAACRSWNTKWAGKPAFTHMAFGYRSGRVHRVFIFAHRVAFAMHYGRWPNKFIDHINGNRIDNRICNLREVTQTENARNCKLQSRNKSGVTGVHFNKISSKWVATIHANAKVISLGSFENFSDAVERRKNAEFSLGYHENHGAIR